MSQLLLENLNNLKSRIDRVCKRCGRDPGEIRIVWVSKTQSREKILEALSIGAGDFGENKVQEALEKFPLKEYESKYRLHFIGRLQSNKVRKIIPICHSIQSVDSVGLLIRINRICEEIDVRRTIFFQINVSEEGSKTGFEPSSFLEALSNLPPCPHLDFRGLMTIGPYTPDPEVTRIAFRRLAGLLQIITTDLSYKSNTFKGMKYLSMGMSDDFEVAIEEGSHYIRIGTNLFGPRWGK
jgi:pyridoxal phosphate enzyme (YggS family)